MCKKILIAEDNPDSRQILEELMRLFQPYDVRVYTARDGMEAYIIAKRETPTIMLLDIMMPRMDGFAVCSKLKNCPTTSAIYIMMVTAKTDPEDRMRATLMGADDYITKPYDAMFILERVEQVLNVTRKNPAIS
jgi:two-component system, OmpR family, alkaline phosphatase synthesis response regulator PhoP